jgi:hypothetical protein
MYSPRLTRTVLTLIMWGYGLFGLIVGEDVSLCAWNWSPFVRCAVYNKPEVRLCTALMRQQEKIIELGCTHKTHLLVSAVYFCLEYVGYCS